jgi:CBS domain-containing protein
MVPHPVWIASSASLLEAVRLMREHDVGGLPVATAQAGLLA